MIGCWRYRRGRGPGHGGCAASGGRRESRTNGALDAFVFLLRLSNDETNDRYQSPPPAHETSPVGGGDDGHATVRYNKVCEPMCDKDGEGQLKNTY